MTKSKEKRIIVIKEDIEEKRKALDAAVKAAEAKHGKGIIMRLDGAPIQDIPVVTSGIVSLDIALGVFGVPRGRTIEIFGPEAGGKSTLSLQIAAEVQKVGGNVLFVDAEHALDLKLARGIGVDTNTLLLSQPEYGEQALQLVEDMVSSCGVDLVIIDSTAALTPLKEIEGEMGDPTMAAQARLMSQAMRKLTGIVAKTKTIVIFINQIRKKVGIMFGNPETTSGGEALKFYSSVRLDTRRIESIKDGTNVIGVRSRIKVVKNKVAPPFRETVVDIIFGRGVSKEGDLLNTAVEYDIIGKTGRSFAFEDIKLGEEEKALELLAKDPVLFNNIREAIISKVKEGQRV